MSHFGFMKRQGRLVLSLALPVCLGAGLAGMAQPASASTTITVSTCDESHLDAAIAQANGDNAGDTVNFSCSGTIDLTSMLNITGSMTLDGSGQQVALDGQQQVGVLGVTSGVTFALNDLTVQDAGVGNGLYNQGGTVTISGSTFQHNAASDGAGAIRNLAGGTVSISGTTFTGNINAGGYGGAVENGSNSTVNITGSHFFDNFVNNGVGGGAIANAGSMTIDSSIFASPENSGYGGAVYQSPGIGDSSSLDIINSDFAYNDALQGGAIYITGGAMNITFSTFADNGASSGSSLQIDGGSVKVGDSVLAGGDTGNCGGNAPTDLGYNAESGTDCGFTGTGDIQNAALNSDGTLPEGSPAIDAVPLAQCPATDLNGNPRPDDPSETGCDMGAYETNYPAAVLSSSQDPSTVGQPVTFTATVGPTDGGGTMAFYADGSATPISGCGTQPLSQASGSTYSATCTTSALPPGTHTISATYSGDSSYPGASGSLAGGQTVNQIPQAISFTAPATGAVGGSTTLTATGGGSGNPVVFSVDPSSGSGVCSTSGTDGATVSYTAAGSCVIDANQAGGTDYAAAPQVTQAITVDQGPAFVVASPPPTATAGQLYAYYFQASGIPAPTYALGSGAPSWLTVNASTGEVSGTPPPGTTSFTYSVTASNGGGTATAGPFTVTVASGAPKADVSATLACPAHLAVGGEGTCTLTVANAGPATARKVTAVIALPASLSQASCSAGCTRHGNDYVWKLASLAKGGPATFTITIKASRAGPASVAALATATTPDPKPLNNIATRQITITR